MSIGVVAQPGRVSRIDLFVPKSSREGQRITLKATVVSSQGPAKGNVTFWDDNEKLGEATLDELGIGSLTTATLKWGSHSITAAYAGEHGASKSSSKRLEVKPTLEDSHHKWSYIQSCATVGALLIAAVWAIFNWWDQSKVRVEHEASAIEAHVEAWGDKDHERTIRGIVTIKNVGNKRETILLDQGPLFVAKVRSVPTGVPVKAGEQDSGKIMFEASQKFWFSQPAVDDPGRYDVPRSNVIQPGGTDKYEFLVQVRDPGTYAVMFSARPSDEEQARVQKEHPETKGKDGQPYRWRWEPSPVFVDVK